MSARPWIADGIAAAQRATASGTLADVLDRLDGGTYDRRKIPQADIADPTIDDMLTPADRVGNAMFSVEVHICAFEGSRSV